METPKSPFTIVKKVEGASSVFLVSTGQLRIMDQLGDSLVFRTIRDKYMAGMMIMGISAGAAAVGESVILNGEDNKSSVANSLDMAPGLGFLMHTIIDPHFAEREHIGRLLRAIAQNPALLGIGIEENTDILVKPNQKFHVIGSGAVYIVDGTPISYSSLSKKNLEGILSVHDVYDLEIRRPAIPSTQADGQS